MTRKQYDELGYRPEIHTVVLPMPKREKGQNDFCVLFLPDNKLMVRWVSSCYLDMDDVIAPYRTRRGR